MTHEELAVYEHHLRASAAFLEQFPKGTLCYTLRATGVHKVVACYGNKGRKDYTFATGHQSELFAFLAGMIVMSHDALDVPAGCIERTGERCTWIAADLCSACCEDARAEDPEGPITDEERRDAEASFLGGYQD